MKRCFAWMLLLVLLTALMPLLEATAETYYVYTANGKTLNLRDEYTNKVIGHIPYGTALEPDMNKSTEIAAYVTYKGKSGFAKWEFLQKTKPKPKNSGASSSAPVYTAASNATPVPYVATTPVPAPENASSTGSVPYTGTVPQDATFEISAVGAYIQYASKSNKGAGDKWASLTVTHDDNIVITADIPKGRKIDYWVINGVRYDFNQTVKTIRLTKATQSFSFEVVYTKAVSQKLLSPEEIQAARTPDLKIVKTIKAQLCHVKNATTGAGGWITEFDFTNDYINRASGQWEQGGQVTAKVKATVGKNQKVRGWKFNETELYPNSTVSHFIVRTLNAAMVYEPILSTVKATTPPRPAPDPEPDPQYYRVSCKNCTFTGGGYFNATSGVVPAGTKITVTNKTGSSEVSHWEVNGSTLYAAKRHSGKNKEIMRVTSNTITRTIKRDTTIACYGVIN